MYNHKITVLSASLLLLTLAGTANAEQGRSPHRQTEGMIERLHDRDNRQARHDDWDHSRDEWQRSDRGRHGRGHNRHDDYSHYDRDLRWGHERWRESDRHSYGGRGYWHDYHYGYHRGHDYRHRYYNNYHYYYNASGFYFPEYGYIARGHVHSRYCPHWHFEDFATGFVLGAIIND